MKANALSATIHSYNQHAADFTAHFERRVDKAELNKFLSLLPQDAYILDAGCGSARDSAYMAQQGYKVLGIDLSEGLLAEAQKIHPEVLTQQMDLTNITLPDKTFDGIWSKAALLHIQREDIPQVLRSFHRILKDGGHLFIQTKKGSGEGPQPVPFDPSLTRHFIFFELDEMKSLVEGAGFEFLDGYEYNGRSRSDNSRDQDWIVLFARK